MTDTRDPTAPPPEGDIEKPDPELVQRVFNAVWRTLAPDRTAKEFYEATVKHLTTSLQRVRLTAHGTRIIGPDEAAKLPDNSADYEPVTFAFEGLDEVKALLAEKIPVAFVTWHHGARHHADFGIARAFPQTAIFARKTFQYGKVFSIPMEDAPAISLVKMDRYLREGRPVYVYLDGPPLGNTVKLNSLGAMSNFSTAPISVFRAVEGIRIIPVSNYYRDGDVVQYIFHPPVPAPDRIPTMNDAEILSSLLSCLEQDLRKRAPHQVLWGYLLHRQQMADSVNRKSALSRREKP